MISKSKYDYYFYLLLAVLVVVLVFVSNTLSISYKEALNVFVNTSVLSFITNSSIYLFGQNDIALRLPFILFYILSVLLMYKMTDNYFKYEKDRFVSILIFMILPGVLSASLLVNSAIIVTFFTLLYLYIYEKTKKHEYFLLVLFLFIDNSFAILFLALFFFSLKKKETTLLIVSLLLFTLSMYIYGFNTDGKPRGYFLDTFAIYATVFSPLMFIYFIYTVYRRGVRGEKSLTWYVTATALLLSLLFSLRQRIYIEDFAPYAVISLPYMLKHFFHSYRVRLKEFRKNHNIVVSLVLGMLLINVLLTIINKPLYLVLPNIEKHFVYKYHFAKELASELKAKKIDYIYSDDEGLLLRLKYYGINEGTSFYLSESKEEEFDDSIIISYYKKELKKYYIINE